MKKLIVVLLSIVMSITVLVGCESEDKSSSDINKQSENSVASLFDKAINDVSLEVEKKAKEQEEQKNFTINQEKESNIDLENTDINNLDEKTRDIIRQVNEYLENEKKNLNN